MVCQSLPPFYPLWQPEAERQPLPEGTTKEGLPPKQTPAPETLAAQTEPAIPSKVAETAAPEKQQTPPGPEFKQPEPPKLQQQVQPGSEAPKHQTDQVSSQDPDHPHSPKPQQAPSKIDPKPTEPSLQTALQEDGKHFFINFLNLTFSILKKKIGQPHPVLQILSRKVDSINSRWYQLEWADHNKGWTLEKNLKGCLALKGAFDVEWDATHMEDEFFGGEESDDAAASDGGASAAEETEKASKKTTKKQQFKNKERPPTSVSGEEYAWYRGAWRVVEAVTDAKKAKIGIQYKITFTNCKPAWVKEEDLRCPAAIAAFKKTMLTPPSK